MTIKSIKLPNLVSVRMMVQPVDMTNSPSYSVELRWSDRIGCLNKSDPRLELPGSSMNLDGFDDLVEDGKAVGKGPTFYALHQLDKRSVC